MSPERIQKCRVSVQPRGSPSLRSHRCDSRVPFLAALSLLYALVARVGASLTTAACAGLVASPLSGVVCSAPCQQATCAALRAFFNSTYNTSSPLLNSWRIKDGWDVLLTETCSQITANVLADGAASYCGWFGVTCCSPELQYLGYCNATNTVMGIKLEVNGLNGSV